MKELKIQRVLIAIFAIVMLFVLAGIVFGEMRECLHN